MTAHLKLTTAEVAQLRTHYHGVVYDALHTVWRYKLLVTLFITAGLAAAAVAIIWLPPRYTSEAILQVNFNRDEPSTTTKIQRVASTEAVAIVETAMRIMRSRALASAVVSRLGLDEDAAYSRPSRVLGMIRLARDSLGLHLTPAEPTPHDLAVERLMNALRINIESRSYVISIAISAAQPERAALIVNTVALEYLRSQRLHQLVEMQRTAERDVVDLNPIFGARHPRAAEANAKLQELQARIAGLRNGDPLADAAIAVGDLLPAEAVRVPSGPNPSVIIAIALVVSLAACGAAIMLLELRSTWRRAN